MNFCKPALTSEQQADLLLQRNLVADRETLIRRLAQVNYYRLSAYLYPFRESGSDDFQPGTSFDTIWERYVFDRQLRLIAMDGIERIEVAVKTCLTQIFTLAHGPFGHLDRQNLPNLQLRDHQRLLSKLRRDQGHSREQFVASYQSKYTSERDVPLWMAIELMDFGSIFTLYRGLPSRLAKAVAREFKLSAPVFESWLRSLNYLRNLCAHHARLLNRNLSIPPMLPQQRTHPEFHQPVPVPVSKVFTALTIQKYLLDQIAPQSHWAKRLIALWDEKHPSISPHLLGFPPDWQSTPIWENTRPRPKIKKRIFCRHCQAPLNLNPSRSS